MNIEDIKSPLPPRKVNFDQVEKETVEEQPMMARQTEVVPQPVPMETETPKKNTKIIFIILGAVLVLILGIFLFLNFGNKKTNNIVTLNYWGLWEDESVMNSIIADFESKNPNIKIDYKKKQKDGYRGLLAGRLAKSGTTEDVPDIFRIHNTWIPMFKTYLSTVPTQTVNDIGLETDFFNVYKKDLKESNQWMAVPLMYDGLAMFYNTDLLSKAGVDVPKDWWSLKKAAAKITTRDSNGKITTAGAALGETDNVDQWSDIVGLMMKQNGFVAMNIGTSANQTKLKDVLSFYTLFKTSDKVWDETLPNSTQYFASGNLGFYFGPSWRILDIQTLNPNLKFGVATMPQLPTTSTVSTDAVNPNAELTDIHWSTYWVEGVNNNSEHKTEAWKFLTYLSSAEVLEKMYQASSQVRSFGEIYPRKSMADKISSNSLLKPFVDTADKADSWYLASNTWDNGVNTQMQKYFSDAIGTVLGNSNSASDAMSTLTSGITQLQKKYDLTK